MTEWQHHHKGIDKLRFGRQQRREQRQRFRRCIEQLRDGLLLHIRDGKWWRTWDVFLSIGEVVSPDDAQARFVCSGGSTEATDSSQINQGRCLFVQDTLRLLQRQGLVIVRSREDEEEEVCSTPLVDKRFTLDPEFQNLLPRSPDEVARLEHLLLTEGCCEPLVVWKGQGILVDGYTRYQFLRLLGRRYRIVEKEFPNRGAVLTYIWDVHYGRRNLSGEAKAYIRGKHFLAVKMGRGGARRGRGENRDGSKYNCCTLKSSAEALAQQFQVSRQTLFHDARFAEALDRLVVLKGDELRQGILGRAFKWTRKDVERLAQLELEEQERVLQEALANRKRPKFESGKKSSLSVNLPRGKPRQQARILEQLLGHDEAVRLARALRSLCRTPRANRGIQKRNGWRLKSRSPMIVLRTSEERPLPRGVHSALKG